MFVAAYGTEKDRSIGYTRAALLTLTSASPLTRKIISSLVFSSLPLPFNSLVRRFPRPARSTMAVEGQTTDTSSGDTVVDQNHEEKSPAAEIPSAALETDTPAQPQDDAVETEDASGAPLDRTVSQAQKMGKKKILVVMAALCVRDPMRDRKWRRANVVGLAFRWRSSWQRWIWCVQCYSSPAV